MTTIERAQRFLALHQGGDVLVLANCWDAASARVFEDIGFPAVATSSAALAWALGRRDGEGLSREELVAAVARICRTVAVPVSVDVVRGFGRTAGEVARTVSALADVGAVGINLEDGMADPQVVVERIAAVRALGLPIFINARTDVYLAGAGNPPYDEAVRRLVTYAEAGADGAFAPGLADLDEITRLARAVPIPLNIYAAEGVPPVRELARAGVRRLSVGCGPMQAVLALTRRIGQELLEKGTYTTMTTGALSYGEANNLFPEEPATR